MYSHKERARAPRDEEARQLKDRFDNLFDQIFGESERELIGAVLLKICDGSMAGQVRDFADLEWQIKDMQPLIDHVSMMF